MIVCPPPISTMDQNQTDKKASLAEKPGRANLFSNLTRNLGPESVVICDSLNYIKGFRYQMYCAAREAHARVCTVRSTSIEIKP
jgi:tRNA uridine 5-carbamoylmethylation protein Kti12